MKNDKSAGNLLRRYLRWPLFFAIVMVLAAISAFILDRQVGIYMSIFAFAGVLIAVIVQLAIGRSILKALAGFAMSTEERQAELARQLDVPYALIDEAGTFLWKNAAFEELLDGETPDAVTAVFREIDADYLEAVSEKAERICAFGSRKYNVVIKDTELDGEPVFAVYLYDKTKEFAYATKIANDWPAVGLIYLDNYEEAMESIDEVKRSLLIALIDGKVNSYISNAEGIVKKLEKDKYLFVMKSMYLSRFEAGNYSILEDVKSVNIGNEMSVTVSVGIGTGSDTYSGNYNYARTAIDMALGRGGDQVVVKNGNAVRYFGGKSQSIEKSTRVKARVKAHAFREIIANKQKLIIMGHRMMDIDCLGSAVGIWRIAQTFEKKAYIVMNDTNSSIREIVERFRTNEYPQDMFINKTTAMELVDEDTVLVVVDVNRPSLTEAPELLNLIDTIVVFDHHRQGTDIIENAALSYIEPFASSACEMVSEIVQYISDNIKLRSVEADAIYSGIVIDTHNFTNQAGVRTFEAAAFLRKSGADITRVRKMFRDSLLDYRAKAEAIHSAEIYRNAFAISECASQGHDSPTVIGAQAANELLDISGIKASIVLTEFDNKIYLSARSIDEVNVQVMMEQLGGGGHRSIAGAQLEKVSMEEARYQVRKVIDEMILRGEVK